MLVFLSITSIFDDRIANQFSITLELIALPVNVGSSLTSISLEAAVSIRTRRAAVKKIAPFAEHTQANSIAFQHTKAPLPLVHDDPTATMTTLARMALLPAELVIECFVLACESECEEYCRRQDGRSTLPPRVGFTGASLLAAIHINRWLRSLLLSCHRLWQLIAEKVVSSAYYRRPTQTTNLLNFCAENCSQRLQRLDLRVAGPKYKSCPRKLMGLIAAASTSTESLQQLSLPHLSRPRHGWVNRCKCSSCRLQVWLDSSALDHRTLSSRTLDLLQDAASLEQLQITVPQVSPPAARIRETTTKLKAHPTRLQLEIRDDPAPMLLDFFVKLVGRVEDLTFSFWENVVDGGFIASLLEAASSTVQRLSVSGELLETAILALFQHELPVLDDLYVWCHPDFVSPIAASLSPRPSFNTLSSLEVPTWMLDTFEAPNLLRAVLTFDNASSVAMVLDKLSQWSLLQDLVVQFDLYNTSRVSTRVPRILRHLTPKSEKQIPCPSLQRLGITSRFVSAPLKWIKTNIADRKDEYSNFDYPARTNLIGSELLDLDRGRREMSQGGEDNAGLTSDSSIDGTLCLPLKVIKILDVHVDPDVWKVLVEQAEHSDELRLCYPDPQVTQRELIEEEDLEEYPWLSSGL